MARKPLPSKDKSHNGLSADEFQKQLLNWFQDRGLLSDLQAHLRHQMIVALRDTSLNIQSAGAFHQAGSPKLQAINLLVAEFLLRQQCHYTLSVFTSEVPLLRNLPEFSTVVSNSTSGIDYALQEDGFPGFHERDVFDILEALGFGSNSEESRIINDLYEQSQGESLLTCLIRSLPSTTRAFGRNVSRSESPEPLHVAEQHAALQQSAFFTEEIRTVLQQSNLSAEDITRLHNFVTRIVEEEVEKTQKKEEKKFHQELIDREQRIQAVWSQHDIEIQEMQQKSEEKLNDVRTKLKEELNSKQAQFAALAVQLQEQQHDVASRLNYIQERSDLIERQEVQLKVMRKESEEYLKKKQEEISAKELHLKEQLARLEAETKAREQEKKELQVNRMQIEEASRAIKESQSEIALLRELQREHNLQLRAAQERIHSPSKSEAPKKKLNSSVNKKKPELSSQGIQVDIYKEKGAIPKKHNAHQQTTKVSHENQSLQTQISATDLEEMILQLHQQNTETERQRSQHAMFGNLVDELQQENTELRGHIEQQRLRIQELTTQASEYMQQLRHAHGTINRLRQQPGPSERDHHAVQTSPRSSSDSHAPIPVATASAAVSPIIPVMDSVPGLALGAYGYHSPPPAPPQPRVVPEVRPPARGFVRSSQVGAGEESYFSRRLPPESFVPLYTSPNHREPRRKPPRRLMVHSVSSSDDSCPSPTEEMLREARRRLRRLEEETAAIDRSYQEFRLRHADSLTNTASILFQPISLSRDYNTNFSLSTAHNLPTRNTMQNPPMFPFSTTYNRSRSARIGLLNQFQSTTILQPGVLQPIPLFATPRTNEQVRPSFSFTSSQPHTGAAVTSLYSVPTEVFTARPHSTQGATPATALLHGPPLSSARVQNDAQNASTSSGTRGDLRLPAGFSLRRQTRFPGERESFQSTDIHQQNKTSPRWRQELPSFTSSVPHMPVVTMENEKEMKGSNSCISNKKPVDFLLRRRPQSPNVSNKEFLEHHLNPVDSKESQDSNLMKDISLQSASDENIGERLLSPPLRISSSIEHDQKSQLHSTKSCTELDESNVHPEPNSEIRSSEPSKSSDNLGHSVRNDSPIVEVYTSKDNQIGSPQAKNSKENTQRKESILEKEKTAEGLTSSTSKSSNIMRSETENKHHQSNDNLRKSESNVYSDTLEANPNSIQQIEEVKEQSQINEDEIKMMSVSEKEKIQHTLEINHATSSESVNSKATDMPPVEVKEQHQSKTLDAHGENVSGKHSNSPSLPSILGSSHELSSDIISAGEDKSDDTW